MKKIILILFILIVNHTIAQLPKVSSGTLERVENFASVYVNARNIDVWLPANYNKQKKYPVLYMHDGQGLFDASITWNHQSWEVDDVIAKLVKENKIKEVIVVGIWNGQQLRHTEYFPQKPFEQLTQIEKDTVTAQLQRASRTKDAFKPISDKYLKFIVSELKPMIDKKYSTRSDRQNTFIAGSSMGGLISMYAICEYPTIFGGAACLSTHWPGTFTTENNPIPMAFVNYLSEHLPNPQSHKLYFDHGDQTLDALYPPLQHNVDIVMKAKGYSIKNWMTQFFPGENHSEVAWNKRFSIPLEFLLNKH
jgi:predicted alpha/beta superfamily hydrolase